METTWVVVLGVVGLVALAVVLSLLSSTYVVVEQSELILIERFGKFTRLLEAGLHFRIPFADRVFGPISMRLQQQDLEVSSKTKDDVTVQLGIALQFRVSDAVKSWYSLDNEQAQFDSFVRDSVRSKVPHLTVTELFETGSDAVASHVSGYLSSRMAGYGYHLDTVLITQLNIDSGVLEAMNQIQAQQRMKLANSEKAEADRIITVKHAEAEAESKRLQGQGIANQRKAIVEGLRESVSQMKDATGIDSKEVLQTILMTQYFDTLKEMGAGSKVVFLPSSPGGLNTLSNEIRQAVSQAGES